MASITITTVGYREIQPLSTAGEAFTVFLLFFGVGTAFYILTAMVSGILEGDLREVFGTRRMKRMIEHLEGHVIVCGFGRVGREAAQDLQERRARFVIMDVDANVAVAARNEGMLVVQGDATNESALREAGIETCIALLAASDSDATNTYITLTAKSLRPDVFVVARVSADEVAPKLRQAGADRIVSPYTMGGRHMALAALQPIMTDFIEMVAGAGQEERILAELEADEESGLAGRSLSEALGGLRNVVVLAVRNANGNLAVGPQPSTVLQAGDRVVVIGREEDLRPAGKLNRPAVGRP
jgi:voltage-gated potassium channel